MSKYQPKPPKIGHKRIDDLILILPGVCWLVMPGGGCVVGPVNEEGALTGDNIAYLYPDFHTALLGQFSDGQLVR